MAEKTTKTELRPIEVAVGAGAAVITAFASSYLGTAGTLTGAALASVIATVSTSVLRTSAQRTNESLLRTTARLRPDRTGPELGGSTAVDPGLAAVDEAELAAAGTGPDGPQEEPPALAGTRLDRARRPAWAVVAAGAVAAFVVALIAITGIESAVGKPLAALIGNEQGGGTTIGRTVGTDPAPAADEDSPTPTSTPSGESAPSESPSTTDEASTTPTAEPTSPTAGPTSGPTTGPPATVPAPATAAPTP